MLKRAARRTATSLAVLLVSALLAGTSAANRGSAYTPAAVDPPPSVWLDIGQWWQDAFPANETLGLPGTAAFDTTSAWIKSGTNYAPGTNPATRAIIPGDTTLVFADASGPAIRVDLVFRILPGPGNYRSSPPRHWPLTADMVLLRLPTDPATPAVAGDASFWGQYMAAPGEFGTPGGHAGGTAWDPLTWNSARCDSAERNAFPTAVFSARVGGAAGLGNQWASMYHEADPKFPVLGVLKFRCFHMDTSLAANQFNVRCDGTTPSWLNVVPTSRTGWDGSSTTREYTKIVPDGLLTPGSHVEYFYRKSQVANPSLAELVPDTSRIVYQPGEASSDMHRWQHLSILPDRWKGSEFGGVGMACMLVVDAADRRGQEAAWISAIDSSSYEALAKRGAHNGWYAPGDVDLTLPENVAAWSVNRNQQPGTLFDWYDVKSAESPVSATGTIGSRYAVRAAGQLINGKWGRTAPTAEMLRKYYRIVTLLPGDVPRELGPNAGSSADDIFVLNDFLRTAGGTAQPRGLWVIGKGFAAAQPSLGFLATRMGMRSVAPSYRGATGYTGDFCLLPDVQPFARFTWSTPEDGEVLAASDDLADVAPALAWGPVTLPAGQAAALVKSSNATENYVVRLDGFDFRTLRGAYSANLAGRNWFLDEVLSTTFAGIACALLTPPRLGAPPSGAPSAEEFRLLGNPVRNAGATLRFSLAAPDRVTVHPRHRGRAVQSLADRAARRPAHPGTAPTTPGGGCRTASTSRTSHRRAGGGVG